MNNIEISVPIEVSRELEALEYDLQGLNMLLNKANNTMLENRDALEYWTSLFLEKNKALQKAKNDLKIKYIDPKVDGKTLIKWNLYFNTNKVVVEVND